MMLQVAGCGDRGEGEREERRHWLEELHPALRAAGRGFMTGAVLHVGANLLAGLANRKLANRCVEIHLFFRRRGNLFALALQSAVVLVRMPGHVGCTPVQLLLWRQCRLLQSHPLSAQPEGGTSGTYMYIICMSPVCITLARNY